MCDERMDRKKSLGGKLTDVLVHTVRMLTPSREVLDQIAQHRRHPIGSLWIFQEKYLIPPLLLVFHLRPLPTKRSCHQLVYSQSHTTPYKRSD